MQIIDLSVSLTTGILSDPPFMLPEIEYIDHDGGAADLISCFPGLAKDDLLEGKGAAFERVNMTTHNGTHLDAPWHYHPTMDNGARAITIDEVPLDWCFRPGVKLDFRDMPDGHVVTADELAAAFDGIDYEPKPYDIVLINTAAGGAYGQDDFLTRGCGFGRDATLWLTERGIKITGTDAWSWDAPFPFTAKKFAETKDPSIIWEGHKAGMVRGYCHLEKLFNLDKLPPFGFTVSCLPIKIEGASAGWTRCVAILDE